MRCNFGVSQAHCSFGLKEGFFYERCEGKDKRPYPPLCMVNHATWLNGVRFARNGDIRGNRETRVCA